MIRDFQSIARVTRIRKISDADSVSEVTHARKWVMDSADSDSRKGVLNNNSKVPYKQICNKSHRSSFLCCQFLGWDEHCFFFFGC